MRLVLLFSIFIINTLFFLCNSAFAVENKLPEEQKVGKAMTFTPLYSYEQNLPLLLDKENASSRITTNRVVKEAVHIEEFENSPLFSEVEFSSYGNVIDPYAWNYSPVNGIESLNTVFYNTYYELDSFGKMTPYASVGLGLAWTGEEGDSNFSGLSTVSELAWNAGFGFDFSAREDVSIDVGYRYSELNTPETSYLDNNLSGKDQHVHQLVFNVELAF